MSTLHLVSVKGRDGNFSLVCDKECKFGSSGSNITSIARALKRINIHAMCVEQLDGGAVGVLFTPRLEIVK